MRFFQEYWSNKASKGLISKDGQLYLNDNPVRIVGTNVYDLIVSCYKDNSPEKAFTTLEYLAKQNVPLVRFSLFGHSYKEYALWFENPEKFLQILEKIVQKAESLHIGLLPSFFWLFHGLPDYFDEPINLAWATENSRTMQEVLRITKTIVPLLIEYKSIWGWEFGNEYNLQCDLHELKFLPPLADISHRSERTKEDIFTSDALVFSMQKWAELVRRLDPYGRIIGSGHGIFRQAQYHRYLEGEWTIDNVAEKEKIFARLHPQPVDCLSEHLYHVFDDTREYEITVDGTILALTYRAHIRLMMELGRRLNQPYCVGEFGHDAFTIFTNRDKVKVYKNMLTIAVEEKVPMMLLWNFAYEAGDVEYSFGATSKIAPTVFKLLEKINTENQKST